jgi:hypothetical protein
MGAREMVRITLDNLMPGDRPDGGNPERNQVRCVLLSR